MTGSPHDQEILDYLNMAGPSTTREIQADLPEISAKVYARLRSLHKRGRVGRTGPLPEARSVLWHATTDRPTA